MNRKIFDNTNPFTVPEGYFDTLQERIMKRVQAEVSPPDAKGRIIRMNPFRTMIATAACILFIFTGAVLHKAYTERQSFVAESLVDDDFYRWFYTSDRSTLLAESLDFDTQGNILVSSNHFEEDDAIISFLERNNISLQAITMLMISD